jgi:hypothetical protein
MRLMILVAFASTSLLICEPGPPPSPSSVVAATLQYRSPKIIADNRNCSQAVEVTVHFEGSLIGAGTGTSGSTTFSHDKKAQVLPDASTCSFTVGFTPTNLRPGTWRFVASNANQRIECQRTLTAGAASPTVVFNGDTLRCD